MRESTVNDESGTPKSAPPPPFPRPALCSVVRAMGDKSKKAVELPFYPGFRRPANPYLLRQGLIRPASAPEAAPRPDAIELPDIKVE
jgi:hypothetical protein